mgnify:CR=1 FL=1
MDLATTIGFFGGIAAVAMLPSPLWFTVVDLVFAYLPMAHMVWWWAGPDAYTDAAAGAAAAQTAVAPRHRDDQSACWQTADDAPSPDGRAT